MKILFVYTNINGFHYDNYHFGVGSLVQTAVDKGHDVNVKILLTKDEYSEFENEIIENTPDLIGFTAVSSQFSHIKKLSTIAKNIFSQLIESETNVDELIKEHKNEMQLLRNSYDKKIEHLQESIMSIHKINDNSSMKGQMGENKMKQTT